MADSLFKGIKEGIKRIATFGQPKQVQEEFIPVANRRRRRIQKFPNLLSLNKKYFGGRRGLNSRDE